MDMQTRICMCVCCCVCVYVCACFRDGSGLFVFVLSSPLHLRVHRGCGEYGSVCYHVHGEFLIKLLKAKIIHKTHTLRERERDRERKTQAHIQRERERERDRGRGSVGGLRDVQASTEQTVTAWL